MMLVVVVQETNHAEASMDDGEDAMGWDGMGVWTSLQSTTIIITRLLTTTASSSHHITSHHVSVGHLVLVLCWCWSLASFQVCVSAKTPRDYNCWATQN